MKKAFLISALAVALVSCGGNSNPNQGDAQSVDSTNAQNKKYMLTMIVLIFA